MINDIRKNLGRIFFMTGMLCLIVSLALNLTVGVTYALPAVQTGDTATHTTVADPTNTSSEAVPDTNTPVASNTESVAATSTITPAATATNTTVEEPRLILIVICSSQLAYFRVINTGGPLNTPATYSLSNGATGSGTVEIGTLYGPFPNGTEMDVEYFTSTQHKFLHATGSCVLNTPTPTNTPATPVTPSGTPTDMPTNTPTLTPTVTLTSTSTLTPVILDGQMELGVACLDNKNAEFVIIHSFGNVANAQYDLNFPTEDGNPQSGALNLGVGESLTIIGPGYATMHVTYATDNEPIVSLQVNGHCDDLPTSTPTNTPTDTPTSTPTNTPTSTPTATSTSTATSVPYQLDLSYIMCVDSRVEVHFILLNVPDGITPGTLTYTSNGNTYSVSAGNQTGNDWHYTDHPVGGNHDITSASVIVNGATVLLQNPGDFAGSFNCAPAILPTSTVTSISTPANTVTQNPAQTATGTPMVTTTGNPTQTGTGNPTRTATSGNTPGSAMTHTLTNTPGSNVGPTTTPSLANIITNTPSIANIAGSTPIPANTTTRTPTSTNTVQIQQAVQASGTAGSMLLAPSIISPTPTVDDPGSGAASLLQQQEFTPTATASALALAQAPAALIPVTGADLGMEQNQKQLMVSRIHQVQTGLNFLGLGLILMGITLMSSGKATRQKKVLCWSIRFTTISTNTITLPMVTRQDG
jgi:hypothetical protein